MHLVVVTFGADGFAGEFFQVVEGEFQVLGYGAGDQEGVAGRRGCSGTRLGLRHCCRREVKSCEKSDCEQPDREKTPAGCRRYRTWRLIRPAHRDHRIRTFPIFVCVMRGLAPSFCARLPLELSTETLWT